MKNLIFIIALTIIILGCSTDNGDEGTDEVQESLLILAKSIISTGSKGSPINQALINNTLVDGFMILQSWNTVETSEGVFDWSHIDSEVNRA